MVTTPDAPPESPGKAEAFTRMLIAGHPAGSVRRIVLYLILTALLAALYLLGGLPAAGGALIGSLIAVLLLAMTDSLA